MPSDPNDKVEDEIILIEEFGKRWETQRGFDGQRNLSINCPELRHLRIYLLLVGQWYPKEWNYKKRACYHIWQVLQTYLNILISILFKIRFLSFLIISYF